jgi:SAM-dependent methyltransferase
MSEQSTRFTGDIPTNYDRGMGPHVFVDYAADLARRTAAARPLRVLEVAAGTGIVTRLLRDVLPPTADLVASDLNPPMLDVARQKFRAGERIEFRSADATALPFPDGTFDAVVCQFGVMFFPDKTAAFAEAARVLAPGGRFVFTAWDRIDRQPLPSAVLDGVRRVLGSEPPDFLARIPYGYHDERRIEHDVTSGGLRLESLERTTLYGRAASAATLAEGFCFGTPLWFALQDQGHVRTLTAKVAEEMTARLGDGPIEGEMPAFVAIARHKSFDT